MSLKTIIDNFNIKAIPLRLILLLPFILQISVAVVITGYVSIRNAHKAVSNVVIRLSEETTDRINHQIIVLLDESSVVNQIITTVMGEELIKTRNLQPLEHAYSRLLTQDTVNFLQFGTPQGTSVLVERKENGLLEARTGEKSDLPNRRIYNLDSQGRRIEFVGIQKFDPRTQHWYQVAIKSGKPVWNSKPFIGTGTLTPIICLSEPIYNKAERLLGIHTANFPLSKIYHFLRNVKVGRTGQAFVINRSGYLIVSSVIEKPYMIKGGDLKLISVLAIDNPVIRGAGITLYHHFSHLNQISHDQHFYFLLDGKRQFVQVSPLQDQRGIDWLSVVVIPESDFMNEIQANTNNTILVCLEALLIATLLGLYTSKWITQSIWRLIQVSEAVARGSLDQTVEPFRIRELGVLSSSFNFMIQQMHESFTALEENREQLEQRVEERTNELTQALQELQSAQVQIIQAEKMSSLGQLVAGVAHEINNPVTFIFGNITYVEEYTQILLELLEIYQRECTLTTPVIQKKISGVDLEFLKEDLPNLLSSMKYGSRRIQKIVKSLRTFSRLDEAELKVVDIHEGIESSLLILQHRLHPRPELPETQIIRHYSNLPLVECYSGQLNQVFMNVLINAIDAIGYDRTNHPKWIKIYTKVINLNWVKIEIADNGPGIAEEIQSRIFDPFFTTKPVGQGIGMGMAISYQIITQQHNGKLNFISAPGEGTKFIIEIPLRQL
jgi:signal transduction histidine kinase